MAKTLVFLVWWLTDGEFTRGRRQAEFRFTIQLRIDGKRALSADLPARLITIIIQAHDYCYFDFGY